jgi:NAD(P)-dependent dehydrogenase (short-subunit alcohol dehydrogenase family)
VFATARLRKMTPGLGSCDAENERLAARLAPQARMGTPEEIADAVYFLDRAAAPVERGRLARRSV